MEIVCSCGQTCVQFAYKFHGTFYLQSITAKNVFCSFNLVKTVGCIEYNDVENLDLQPRNQ